MGRPVLHRCQIALICVHSEKKDGNLVKTGSLTIRVLSVRNVVFTVTGGRHAGAVEVVGPRRSSWSSGSPGHVMSPVLGLQAIEGVSALLGSRYPKISKRGKMG